MTDGCAELAQQFGDMRAQVRRQLGRRYANTMAFLGQLIAHRAARESSSIAAAAVSVIRRTEMLDSPPAHMIVAAIELLERAPRSDDDQEVAIP